MIALCWLIINGDFNRKVCGQETGSTHSGGGVARIHDKDFVLPTRQENFSSIKTPTGFDSGLNTIEALPQKPLPPFPAIDEMDQSTRLDRKSVV